MARNLGKKTYGPHKDQYRRRIQTPTGGWKDIYGRSGAELDEKEAVARSAWAEAERLGADPYFYEYARDWYRRVSGDLSEARRASIRREINKNLCPVLGQLRLSEITSDDVADVMAARAGLSRSAREKTLQALRRILTAAVDAGKIERNPAKSVKIRGKAPGRREALTPDQETALLKAVDGLPVELPIRLGLYLGLRREEVYGLRWRDVHLEGKAPHVEVRCACRWPKNTQPELSEVLKSSAAWRTLPVPPALLPALRAAREAAEKRSDKPLPGRTVVEMPGGGPWTYQAHRRAWSAVTARTAGEVRRYRKDPETGEQKAVAVTLALGDTVPKHPGVVVSLDFPVSSHTLRHTYITRLVLGGMDVRRAQYLAGHETADVTLEIYTSLMGHRPEDLIEDVSKIFPA